MVQCFMRNGMDTMDSRMALKDHSGFKIVHDGSQFHGQFKDKVFAFNISVNLANSGWSL